MYEPDSAMLDELTEGGKFPALRSAANSIMRDLKMRFFVKIRTMFKQAVTNDAIAKGRVHTAESLYQSPWGETVLAPYGSSNQRKDENLEFILPAFAQHLPVWSETASSTNLATGRQATKLFVGGPILSNFIKELAGIADNDELAEPNLDALSVFIAYCAAKEAGIRINHGFNLKLAAHEWKTWCALSLSPSRPRFLSRSLPRCLLLTTISVPALRVLNNNTPKKGPIVSIVKKYMAGKKAERDARAARGAAAAAAAAAADA